MRHVVLLVAVLAICSVYNVSATGGKLRSLSTMKTVVPVLKKPVILNSGWNNPNADAEAQEIINIIAKEPQSATPKQVDPDDLSADFAALEEAEKSASKSHSGAGGGAAGGAKTLGQAEADAESAEAEDAAGEKEEKSQTQKEIQMLQELIDSGKKIQSQMPEKEARLAELQKRMQSNQAEENRGQAQRKIDEQMILMRELDAKIDKLNRKMSELTETKKGLQAEIDANNAIIKGNGGKPDAAAKAEGAAPAAAAAKPGAPAAAAAPPAAAPPKKSYFFL